MVSLLACKSAIFQAGVAILELSKSEKSLLGEMKLKTLHIQQSCCTANPNTAEEGLVDDCLAVKMIHVCAVLYCL